MTQITEILANKEKFIGQIVNCEGVLIYTMEQLPHRNFLKDADTPFHPASRTRIYLIQDKVMIYGLSHFQETFRLHGDKEKLYEIPVSITGLLILLEDGLAIDEISSIEFLVPIPEKIYNRLNARHFQYRATIEYGTFEILYGTASAHIHQQILVRDPHWQQVEQEIIDFQPNLHLEHQGLIRCKGQLIVLYNPVDKNLQNCDLWIENGKGNLTVPYYPLIRYAASLRSNAFNFLNAEVIGSIQPYYHIEFDELRFMLLNCKSIRFGQDLYIF